MSTINLTAHGLTAGKRVAFSSVVPTGTGIDEEAIYYVISAGLTADAFQIADIPEGTPITLSQNITSASMQVVPDSDDSDTYGTAYSPITSGTDVMAPPTAPDAPTGVGTETDTVEDTDGTVVPRLTITWTPPTDTATKVRETYVQVTFKTDGDPANPQPVWDADATIYTVPPTQSSLTIEGILSNTTYYVRVWVADVFGTVSAATTPVSQVTSKDETAPAVPTGLVLTASLKSFFAKWATSSAKDLAFYELRYAKDNGSGTAPDTSTWATIRAKTSAVYVGNLISDSNGDGVADQKYWVQVRAVDTSGNTQDHVANGTADAGTDVVTTSTPHGLEVDNAVRFTGLTGGTGLLADTTYYVIASGLGPSALKVSTSVGGAAVDITVSYTNLTVSAYPAVVNYLSNPEAGWGDLVSIIPALTGDGDISWGSIKPYHIDYLDAGKIKTGDLQINTTDVNMVDGIKVYNGVNLVGLWNENGLYIYDNADTNDYVHLYDAGITVYLDGSPVASLTTQGLDAASIGFGTLPGGHNLILNSSFELNAFSSITYTNVTWNVLADWSGTMVSETNITEGAGALTMTGVTY